MVFLALAAALPLQLTALAAAPRVDLAFTQLVTVGQNAFTEVFGPQPQGISGRMVFAGTRNGVRTLYLLDDGVVIEVLPGDGTLPNGMGTATSFVAQYRMTPDGDILFRANVSGGSLAAGQYTFRWRNGVITVQEKAGPNFSYMTSDGRWLVEEESGTFPINTFSYFLTDGTTMEPLISLTGVDTQCHTTRFKVHAANANGVVAYSETKIEKSVCALGKPSFLTEWSIRLGGTISRTLLSGSFTTRFGSSIRGGTDVDMLRSILNDSNELLMVLKTYDGVTSATAVRQNVVLGSSGGVQRVLFDTSDPQVFANLPTSFDGQGRIAVVGRLGSVNGPRALLRGDTDNPAQDVVIQEGDPLFGSTLLLLQPTFSADQDLAIPGENRGFYFTYELADGTKGIGLAVAQKDVTRWANSAGGAWGEAENWSPAAVPGSTAETLFNLEASYDVTVGTQRAGRALIENGSVGFQSSALTLTGPLHVGGDASLTVPGGTLAAGEVIVGHLPPLDLVNEPTARFNASGSAFALNVTGPMIVGEAGRGEVFITEGSVSVAELRISALARGAVALGLPGTFFKSLGSVAVGDQAPGTLDVERGAVMSVEADFVVGRGASGAAPVSGVSRATFRDPPQKAGDVGSLAADRIIVGGFLPGRLEVLDGAIVDAFGFDASGSAALITGTASNPAVLSDASILVSGQAGPGKSSALNSIGDVELGAADGAGTDVVVENGGEFTAYGAVAVGSAAGSRASVTVTGRGPSGAPSSLNWLGDKVIAGEDRAVDVGYRGVGTVDVLEGASMEVLIMNIGRHPGSRGRVTVGSTDDGSPSTLRVSHFSESLPTGFLTVGGVATSGTGEDAVGILELDGGEVVVDTLINIYPKGVLRGRGRVSAPIMLLDGSVEPSVVLAEVAARAPDGSGKSSAMSRISLASFDGQPKITLVGNVVLQATAVVKLDIPGSEFADRIVVDGPLTLGGTLELNFANGYAPRAGETLDLITSTLTTGSFATTTINGLAPGFQFTLAPNGAGGVRLTAINDGVAATVGGGRLSVLYSPGELWLTWANTNALEEATNLTGPWRTITNAVSPHVVSTTNATHQFFRLRWPAP